MMITRTTRPAPDVTNYRLVWHILAVLLLIEGLLMLVPMTVCLSYGEQDWLAFVKASGASVAVAIIVLILTGNIKRRILYRREGYMVTSAAWIMFSVFGMIPFMCSSHPLGLTDAFFETMSGFTTTGASVIADVESLSHGILLWRSQIQWTGGLGIVLFMLAVLPSFNSPSSLPMFNAEITGVTHDKLHPRIRQTAKSLWSVYVVLTVALMLMLWVGPMDLFDSVCHSLSTLSTGGFSTRNAGISAWNSDYVALTVTLFMLLGGVNFVLLYNSRHGNVRGLWRNDVSRAYMVIAVVALMIISLSLVTGGYRGFTDLFVRPIFLVASAGTSTGYSYGDFEAWGSVTFVMVIFMMTVGACAGSTTGGMKIDRLLVMCKNMRVQIRKTLFPNHIEYVRLNGRVVDHETMSRISAFATSYLCIMLIGTLVVCAMGIDFDDSLFGVVSCMGNSGLGYGITGVGGGYGLLPDAVKWLMSILMLVGRLEIFTILILLTARFWRR